MGLYSIVENIDNHFAVDRFGTKKGTLFKPVARRLFEDLGDKWDASPGGTGTGLRRNSNDE